MEADIIQSEALQQGPVVLISHHQIFTHTVIISYQSKHTSQNYIKIYIARDQTFPVSITGVISTFRLRNTGIPLRITSELLQSNL